MADQVAPAPIKEAAPEASARDILKLDDSELLSAVGLDNLKDVPPIKEKAAPKEEVKEVAKPVEGATKEEVKEEVEEELEEEVDPDKPVKEFQFKVADEEGELEVPEDLKITFTANGKTRENVPLEKVVQLAQMGVYNHEKEQELEQREQKAIQATQDVDQLVSLIKQYETALQTVLADPDRYDDARIRFQEMNTPEAKAKRERDALEKDRETVVEQRDQLIAVGFIKENLVPFVTKLVTDNPLVSVDEVMGRYGQLTAPMLVKGRVPLDRLMPLKNVVERDLAAWVQKRQLERDEKQQTDTKVKQKAEAETKKLKRQLARTVAPAGGPGAETSKPVAFDSAKSWFDKAFPTGE